MLPRENRILKDKEFSLLYRKGKFVSCGYIMIKFLPTQKENPIRFGIVISTKVTKKATARNKVKRQIRDILKKRLPKLPSGYDVVVMTNKDILEKSYKDIDDAINELLTKAKLL